MTQNIIEVTLSNGQTLPFSFQFKPDKKTEDFAKKYLKKFFDNPYQGIITLFGKYPSEFDEDLNKVLKMEQGTEYQDRILNLLVHIWFFYNNYGSLVEADNFWKRIHESILQFEITNKIRIHKGSLFYYWSHTALKSGNIDKTFLLIHQSLKEDQLTTSQKYPNTPSFKTATLNFIDSAQYMFSYIIELRDFISTKIIVYNHVQKKNFTLKEFHKRFLDNPHDIDVIFNFTYTVALLKNLQNYPQYILENNFSGLYITNIIFNLILVIDSAIHNKMTNPDDWQFIKLAKHLLVSSGENTNSSENAAHLSSINSEGNIQQVIENLLDAKIKFSTNHTPSKLERFIFLTYKLRNFSAHNLNSIPIIYERKGEIIQALFEVLFLTVESLY